MNSKNIKAVEDECLCMKCLKNKATHIYPVSYRGYGSIYDMTDTKFQCCDECDRSEYKEWFFETPTVNENEYAENYKYEDNIYELIKSLPLESQELFENRFDNRGWQMVSQDWIDYKLDELPHEKCKEYGLYSPKDIEAYNNKFTTCEHVANVVWNDNSKGSWCPFGASGDYGQKIDECGNLSDECTDCRFYKKNVFTQFIRYTYVIHCIFPRKYFSKNSPHVQEILKILILMYFCILGFIRTIFLILPHAVLYKIYTFSVDYQKTFWRQLE